MDKIKKWNWEGFCMLLIILGLGLASNKSINNSIDLLFGFIIFVLPISLIFAIMTRKD